MATETRGLKEIRINGAVARLIKARKTHKCHACGEPIEPGENHYCIYYGGGLGSLKFPDRVHERCLIFNFKKTESPNIVGEVNNDRKENAGKATGEGGR